MIKNDVNAMKGPKLDGFSQRRLTLVLKLDRFRPVTRKLAGSEFSRKPRRGEAQGCADQCRVPLPVSVQRKGSRASLIDWHTGVTCSSTFAPPRRRSSRPLLEGAVERTDIGIAECLCDFSKRLPALGKHLPRHLVANGLEFAAVGRTRFL